MCKDARLMNGVKLKVLKNGMFPRINERKTGAVIL